MFHLKLLFQFSFILFSYSSEINGDIIPPMVGGQRDSNNCLIGAGFTWCDSSQECIRKWETPCADNYNNCSDCLKKQRKAGKSMSQAAAAWRVLKAAKNNPKYHNKGSGPFD